MNEIKSKNKIKILLVEDEVLIAIGTVAELNKNNFESTYVTSGIDAINYINDNKSEIDLILMDIDLGNDKLNGAEAAIEILKRHDIPIIFNSSHIEDEIIKETEKITSYGYIYKGNPISVKIATINMAMRLFQSNLEIKQSEEKFMTAFMLNPAAMTINKAADNYAIIDCNASFEKITGFTKEEVIGKTAIELGLFGDETERQRMKSELSTNGELRNFKHLFKNRLGVKYETVLSTKNIIVNNEPHLMVCQLQI